ncbi:MAG: hypothetical protein RML36_16680 [Anaerolineae bacterium]|nr:hypothetical protein [Anaerolineae bacterium]MDW8101110.1 hypothetical protein [Anaerolineae bacterium]
MRLHTAFIPLKGSLVLAALVSGAPDIHPLDYAALDPHMDIKFNFNRVYLPLLLSKVPSR